MRQRIILVAIALVASVLTAEIAVNAQRPAGTSVAQQAQGNRAAVTNQVAQPTATVIPVATQIATPPITVTAVAVPPAIPTSIAWMVTARQAVPQGTLLRSEQVVALFQRTPLTSPTGGGTISTLNDLSILLGRHGRVITSTLLSGDPITLPEIGLGLGETPSLSNQIPQGGVAVSLQIDGAAALQGIVSVGDDVDVWAAASPDSPTSIQGNAIQVRRLSWARVIALGPLTNEVTVMIPTASSQAVISAEERGTHFHLVLRSSQSPELLSPSAIVSAARNGGAQRQQSATTMASPTTTLPDSLPLRSRTTIVLPAGLDVPAVRSTARAGHHL